MGKETIKNEEASSVPANEVEDIVMAEPAKQPRARTIQKRRAHVHEHEHTMTSQLEQEAESHEAIHKLQDALRLSGSIETSYWNFHVGDWVTNIQCADIDNDGDIEVLISARDGRIYALTHWGSLKWQTKINGLQISSLCAVPSLDSVEPTQASGNVPRVIVATRSGQVLALNEKGLLLPGWRYVTDRMIRQVYISPQHPRRIIIGSEDRCVHILDTATGKPVCDAFRTNGWVRSVFACDIDGDGQEEILAGSGDKNLYILDFQGRCLDKFSTGFQIYTLYAAALEPDGPVQIIMTSNRKDLSVWTISKRAEKRWTHKKEWEIQERDGLFQNRLHSVRVIDLNSDGIPEILAGSEDGYLYILDHRGALLWKHFFGSCVYCIHAADIDFDGQVEILTGTEDYGAFSLYYDLAAKGNPAQQIQQSYQKVRQTCEANTDQDLSRMISLKERSILREFVENVPAEHHVQMEMADAVNLMEKRYYEKALAIFLRLRRQIVQYYWAQPFKVKGYIWTLNFCHITPDHKDDIIVGTDEGHLYAIDTEKDKDKQLWTRDVGDRVRMVQAGATVPDALDSIFAVLANHRVLVVDPKGEITKEHTFKNKLDWAHEIYLNKKGDDHNLVQEVIIGLENKKISIWDAQLQKEQLSIDMPQGIHSVYSQNIAGPDSADIISGSLEDQVYACSRAGETLWSFPTKGRVQALHVADIDRDGHVEVIVGSEDRNVYVIDHEGHLKWYYRTLRGVMDIDVCALKLEHDPEQQKLTILISGADNCLYALDANGDLLWKYMSMNRIRAVRAKDVNGDGKIEIAVASENQLELLQIVNREELIDTIQRCWDELIKVEDHRSKIMELTHHVDPYIRAFALAKLAGQITRLDDDFKRLQEALLQDDALEVKRELVRAIVVLCRMPKYRGENTRQARQFLQTLANAPEQEIRLEIVKLLPFIAEYEVGLCFEYLEYFMHSVDRWVRRDVVRQLDKLVEKYPERVFRLLLKAIDDEKNWVKLESARVLAHYFDAHPQRLVPDLLLLIDQRVGLTTFKQISYSAHTPAMKKLFISFVDLLQDLNSETIMAALDTVIAALKEVRDLEQRLNEAEQIVYSEELLQVYEEFRQLFLAKTIDTIAHLQWITDLDIIAAIPYRNMSFIIQAFAELHKVVSTVQLYERRSTQGDRAVSLFTANDILDRVRHQLQEEEIRQLRERSSSYSLPEYTILSLLLDQWSRVIKTTLYRLRGNAQLAAEIQNPIVRPEEEIVVALLIRNEGHSPADNLSVELDESDDFTIVGSHCKALEEISTDKEAVVTFKITPCENIFHLRLSFQITYDDAETLGRRYSFATTIVIEGHQRPYQEIPNPYNSGTPIRDETMFYGRTDDLADLHDKLKSLKANKVVVLSGQRRMGKTSLIYQLAHQLKQGADTPVFIDLQSFSLVTNVGQLLYKMALCTCEEVLKYRDITVSVPEEQAFLNNPTATFDRFIQNVLKALSGRKLIFLLDEFEKLQEHIDKKILDEKILQYLRSLMQHQDRLNFLLVSAPSIRYLTEPYWAVFFNITLQHRLSKLKEEEALALIVQPVQDYLEYDMLALKRIRQLSGDQPYLIHVICGQLIGYCNKLKKTAVTVNDVNIVLKHILEEQTSSIYWIWHQFSSPTEHFLLSILAQEQHEEGRFFPVNSLRAEYDNQGVLFVKKAAMQAIDKLAKEDILEERLDGTQFRIPVGLFREWLRKAKPPERVVREEPLLHDE